MLPDLCVYARGINVLVIDTASQTQNMEGKEMKFRCDFEA